MTVLRLRPGTHYAPIDGGVYFSSVRASFVVKGPRLLFPVVDICVPLLEDGSDLDGLVAAVGMGAARPLISRLLGTFDDRGLLLHLDRLSAPAPSPEQRARFPETLAYLEAHCDDPYAAFGRVRTAHVVVTGPAEALAPAVRGLVRAGAGQVTAACDRPEHLARLAARQPHVRVVAARGGFLVAPSGGTPPDVVIIVSHDEFPPDLAGQLPESCLTIPVRLGKDLAIVGPAVAAHVDQLAARVAAEALWARAGDWQSLDGSELLVQPSGDRLAGALAGQAALDALAGLNRGRVQLVHGPDLASDTITPAWAPGAGFASPAGATLPAPAGEAATESPTRWHEPMSARWVGLFRLAVPGELPQMPLALTLADGRSQWFQGRVAGFGPDQGTASSEAGLEALRRHCAGLALGGRGGPAAGGLPCGAVAAAGLDETRGMHDGALRLLARDLLAGSDGFEVAWLDLDDVAARRLWRTLEDHEQTPVVVTARQAGGAGWHLVTVSHLVTEAPLASGWGPSREVAARVALSSALATAQIRRTVDAGYPLPPPGAGYVAHVHDAFSDQLVASTALGGGNRRLYGQRLVADAIAGAIGAWCGWVWTGD